MTAPFISCLQPVVTGPFVDAQTGATYHSVVIDAAESWAAGADQMDLRFEWTVPDLPEAGIGVLPTFAFSVATIADPSIAVHLVVTDPNGQATTVDLTVDLTLAVQPRIVAGLRAGARVTTNGGLSFVSFGDAEGLTPTRQPDDRTVTAVGQDLMWLVDGLPQTLFTFPAPIVSIFCNPAASHRFTVGLTNGDVWRSIDDGAHWNSLYTFGPTISVIYESPNLVSTFVAAGNDVWVTRRSFTDTPARWASSDDCRIAQFVVSAYASYIGCDDAAVREVATGHVLAGPTSSITGLAFNPRHGTLWVLEQNGHFWRMRQGESTLTNLSTVPGGGGQLVPITAAAGLILTANGAGTWISPDAGVTWRLLLGSPASSVGAYLPPTPGSY
jgi:hypothetical protein